MRSCGQIDRVRRRFVFPFIHRVGFVDEPVDNFSVDEIVYWRTTAHGVQKLEIALMRRPGQEFALGILVQSRAEQRAARASFVPPKPVKRRSPLPRQPRGEVLVNRGRTPVQQQYPVPKPRRKTCWQNVFCAVFVNAYVHIATDVDNHQWPLTFTGVSWHALQVFGEVKEVKDINK